MAKGKHPAPFRTRKLSLSAPMVLHGGPCGRLGRRRTHTLQGWSHMTTPEVFLCDPYGKPSADVEASVASSLVLDTQTERGHWFGSGGLCRLVDRWLRLVVVSQSLGDVLEVPRQPEAPRLAVRLCTPP